MSERTTPLTPPNLQLLYNWIKGFGAELENVEATIEKSFSTLANAFPDNPFVFLYWADAVKAPIRLGVVKPRGRLAPAIEPNTVGLPISVLEKSVEKLERAYQIAPHLNITASRIVGTSFMIALSYPENGLDHKKWMKKVVDLKEKAKVHMDDMSGTWKVNENVYDWGKYGLEIVGREESSKDTPER